MQYNLSIEHNIILVIVTILTIIMMATLLSHQDEDSHTATGWAEHGTCCHRVMCGDTATTLVTKPKIFKNILLNNFNQLDIIAGIKAGFNFQIFSPL